MSTPLIIPPDSPLITALDTVVLDASWLYQPPPTRNAYQEFLSGPRFPGARFWDLDAVSEPAPEGFMLMLPSPQRFASFAGKLGISRHSHVVVYDGEGIFAAPRTAWAFKVYGHEKVSVINGGLPRARKEGIKLEDGPPVEFEATTYPVPSLEPGAVAEFNEISKVASRPSVSADGVFLIDARPSSSYQSGHIPTSLLLDFPSSLLEDPSGYTYLRDPAALKAYLGETLGQDVWDQISAQKSTVINTCGGGLSAAINWLTFQSVGIDSRLYDESWSGYSAREGTPKVTGPNPL